ncbi:dipeptidase [Aurantiacibacter gilvus]|uniref:Membrane dipeptidase n=1 Tax=Aurantiacibacter gilvus TaxID=3139141 RepID=A0ABU9IGQ9_9SPHN
MLTRRIGRRGFVQLGGCSVLGACATVPGIAEATAAERAARLVSRSMVINGNLLPGFPDIPEDADFAAQVRATGLTAVKFSLAGPNPTFAETQEYIAGIDDAIVANARYFTKIGSAQDLLVAKHSERVGVIYAFEATTMLEGNVARIDVFHRLGVRSMQLSYNGASPFAAGVNIADSEGGLTELGREAVDRMNTLGVTIDASHSNARSTSEIIAASQRPVMISHAGCAAVHPHPRNRSDATLRAIADSGGLVGLYELPFLTPGSAQQGLADLMRHIEHALNVCGEDGVGIGSDGLMFGFDTSEESLQHWNASIEARREAGVSAPGEGPPPFVTELNGPHRMVRLAEELLRRGHRESVVEKVLGRNFLRVFAETWA